MQHSVSRKLSLTLSHNFPGTFFNVFFTIVRQNRNPKSTVQNQEGHNWGPHRDEILPTWQNPMVLSREVHTTAKYGIKSVWATGKMMRCDFSDWGLWLSMPMCLYLNPPYDLNMCSKTSPLVVSAPFAVTHPLLSLLCFLPLGSFRTLASSNHFGG